ncbi:short chain dehydrogenase [Oscillochloris sp. ZM17-4]|uniref:proton-conducting transporter transmembrane domain-containing protein n=1 Tax=Oscillochloris sp. ZM17-4 TaxID=2866714 RepID=UPI001C735C01|nr:proton-conducting transporter membrane subunit [Oscillochloris sp. ZM17-4]MBX0327473.1 short chain dehydrogenase [Oscillochloris sp. ZM17-4]
MANHLFLPFIVPIFGAALAVLLGQRRPLARAAVLASVLFNVGYGGWLLWLVISGGRLVAQASGWPAPFGISLVADALGATMLLVAALLMLGTLLYGRASTGPIYDSPFYEPLLLLLLLGVSGAFLTGDLFNLYVWFEVLLMASFGLITLGGTRAQLVGGLKYVVLNLFGSTAFLIGCGLIYGLAGTLNMAHLGERMAALRQPGLSTAIAGLFLFAFGSKAAIAPLFFWLPDSYHTPPPAVTAIFSGLMTKVGVYALYRVFGIVLPGELALIAPLILALAGVTMVVGVIGAMAQMNIRRILSFHIVSQIGYSIMGLGLASAAGLAAGLLFTTHVMIVKAALFFLGGAVEQVAGTGDLKKLGGMARREPALATFWFLGILSLAGIPPMSGFFGKLALLQAGVAQGQLLITGVAAGVSLLTFFSMLKIWNEVFWKKSYEDMSKLPRVPLGLLLPGALLVLLSLAIGVGAGPISALSAQAGAQALDLSGYAQAVCGAGGCEAAVSDLMK